MVIIIPLTYVLDGVLLLRLIDSTQQNTAVKMNNSQAHHRPSITSNHTINTRAQGNALMGLPEALRRAELLQPSDPQVRSLMADGSTKYNAPYLALRDRSQSRRKKLVLHISELLGDDMDAWHDALHRPESLPKSALDWSTVLLQQTLDLTRSVTGNLSTQRLQGVYQDMKPNSKRSGPVKAAIHLDTVDSKRSKNKKVHQLKEEVENLQQQIEDWKDRLEDERTFYEMMAMVLEQSHTQQAANVIGAEGSSSHDIAAQHKMRRLEDRVKSRDCTIEDVDLALATQHLTIQDLTDERPVPVENENPSDDESQNMFLLQPRQNVSPVPPNTLLLRQRIRLLETQNHDSLNKYIDDMSAKEATEAKLRNRLADYRDRLGYDSDYEELPDAAPARGPSCLNRACTWPYHPNCVIAPSKTAYVSTRRSSSSEISEEL